MRWTNSIFSSESGSDRARLPVSANTAFAIWGATSGTRTSPMPPVEPCAHALRFWLRLLA